MIDHINLSLHLLVSIIWRIIVVAVKWIQLICNSLIIWNLLISFFGVRLLLWVGFVEVLLVVVVVIAIGVLAVRPFLIVGFFVIEPIRIVAGLLSAIALGLFGDIPIRTIFFLSKLVSPVRSCMMPDHRLNFNQISLK